MKQENEFSQIEKAFDIACDLLAKNDADKIDDIICNKECKFYNENCDKNCPLNDNVELAKQEYKRRLLESNDIKEELTKEIEYLNKNGQNDLADKYADAIMILTKLTSQNCAGDRCPVYTKSRCDVGDVIKFGSYEQDNNISNGKEDIEWIVLAVEGNKALVISKYALDCQPYNTTYTNVAWETCTLRSWLNSTFLNTAFSSSEQAKILTTKVTAEDNKIFLLSISEVNKYFSSNDARKCIPTAYAKAQGVYVNNGKCWYWLRSPGRPQNHAANVDYDGSALSFGDFVSHSGPGVRPAMWINLN